MNDQELGAAAQRDATDAGAGDSPPAHAAPGGVGPRPAWRRRLDRWRVQARRGQVGRLVVVALVAGVVGVGLGRVTAPDPGAGSRPAVERSVLLIALEADGIWTSSSEGRAAVSDGLVALRREDDTAIVEEHLDGWLTAYDAAVVRIAGVDLDGPGRPIQRQLITALTLSRDAVEVLGHAATVDDEVHRLDLTTEVGRLRSRSEQLIQSARASTAELDGGRTDVSPLPALRDFLDGRRR